MLSKSGQYLILTVFFWRHKSHLHSKSSRNPILYPSNLNVTSLAIFWICFFTELIKDCSAVLISLSSYILTESVRISYICRSDSIIIIVAKIRFGLTVLSPVFHEGSLPLIAHMPVTGAFHLLIMGLFHGLPLGRYTHMQYFSKKLHSANKYSSASLPHAYTIIPLISTLKELTKAFPL